MKFSRGVAALVVAIAAALAGIAYAQSSGRPVDTKLSREALEQATREGCDPDASVVVQRCLPPASNPAGTPNGAAPKANDPLTKSREKAKAGFDRRDRETQKAILDGKKPDPSTDGGSGAQRLGPVTVTGTADKGDPPKVEEVLEKALNPPVTVLPNGNTVTYGPDGSRLECQARCTGPMCCKRMRAIPSPVDAVNSMGR